MRKRRMLSLLLCVVLLLSLMPMASARAAGDAVRYTVLVLDTSSTSDFIDESGAVFYTAGTAIDYVKTAAKAFVKELQQAEGTNYVSIVSYRGDSATVVSQFSQDGSKLNQSIDSLSSSQTTRSVAAGLTTAYDLIQSVDENCIKNVVLFTTGMTNDGPYSYDGLYDESTVGSNWRRTDTNIRLYAYSNSAIAVADQIKSVANLYSIGLFQTMEQMPEYGRPVVEFFKLFARDCAKTPDDFYEVTDPEKLEVEFGQVADSITKDNYPIIIIPGIMGSRLFTSSNSFNDSTRLWDPVIDGVVGTAWDVLKLHTIDGLLGISFPLYVRPCENQQDYEDGGTSKKYGREYGARDTYKDIVDHLCNAFPDREIYFFSYDWRESNSVSASKLNNFILSLKAEKVDLLCHSMGGLVASSYYANHGTEGRLNKVITCGTPYEGAPKLINSVMNWDVLGQGANPREKNTWIDLGLALGGGLTKDVKTSFQGVVELTPTNNYCKRFPMWKDSWAPLSIGDYQLSYEDYVEICGKIFGDARFTDAMRFQQSLHKDNAFEGYNALLNFDHSYFIIGKDNLTISAVKFQFTNNDIDQLLFESDLGYTNQGDGTVPYYSASISEQVQKLQKDSRWFTYSTDHGGTISDESCRDLIVNLLKDSDEAGTSDPDNHRPYTVIRIACPVDATISRENEVLTSVPAQLSTLASFGRMDILGADDEIKIFAVYTDELSNVVLQGTGDGTMDYSVRNYDGYDQLIEEYAFEDVPITEDTVIRSIVDPDAVPVLLVDADGDGNEDETWTAVGGEVVDSPDHDISDSDVLITFDGNGGTPSVRKMRPNEDSKLDALPTAVRDGYTFDGWYTEPEGGDPVDPDEVYFENQTLYAHWTAAEATVTPSPTVSPTPTPSAEPAVTPTPTADPAVTPTPTVKPTPKPVKFVDVPKDAYYYDAVYWAVNTDPVVTTGTDETHFSPAKDCTRAQMVTFLWRASGEPEPTITKNPFKDVKSSDYFYKAVLWAVEKGITKGTTATTFSPNATVTRAQTVTFLWRMAGEPAVNVKNPFTDVKAGQYYTDAVLWAVKNKVTTGKTASSFAPNDPCTRAQIVTFLYRDLV